MRPRRYYVPNAVVFITQVVARRTPLFAEARWIDLLRATLHRVQEIHPYTMLGYVFLPDHLHLLIQPAPPETYSTVMHSLKPNFALAYRREKGIPGQITVWQKSFYEHSIRDEDDFEHHLHYIHYNPVKHGYVSRPEEWPHSSLAAWKAKGAYPEMWRWSLDEWSAAVGPRAEGDSVAGE